MARVQGIKEKVHAPLYDALFLKAPKVDGEIQEEETLCGVQKTRLFRFFMDVQGKTRLETNLQAAGVLPSSNMFEARAMRVVISTLRKSKRENGAVNGTPRTPKTETSTETKPSLIDEFDAAAQFANDFVFNSVTSLLVGEKVMIEMPTYWFPSGAGVFASGAVPVVNHGQPDPLATFRFAEPVFIEPQQNFRVEILFPNDVPDSVLRAAGPLRIWVVLDGYLTRDAQ